MWWASGAVSLLALLPRGDAPPRTPRMPAAVTLRSTTRPGARRAPRPRGVHPRDELFDSFVYRTEGVLAQDGALGLVVQLQVHPVDGEVTPLLLCPPDELPAQLGPGGLRWHRLSLEDVDVTRGPLHRPGPLQQVVQATSAVHVVISQVQLGHPGRGQRQVVPGPVPLDQLILGHPVDLPR